MSDAAAPRKKRRPWLWAAVTAAVLLGVLLLNLLLQNVISHLEPYFVPNYERVDLSPVLAKPQLTEADYALIFEQTGLGRAAVDELLTWGELGTARILETQERFLTFTQPTCLPLIPGRITCEERLLDEDGAAVYSVPLAPLQQGDILVSFSTHTVGWHHGHAGLVIDAGAGYTLESAVLFSNSGYNYASHWRTYSNFMILRVKDADRETRSAVAQFAMDNLWNIPYRLTSGIFGPKAPDPDSGLVAHCSYLPWYAWQAFGVDLDGDGGRIVTPLDLAESPYVEVVQVYGIDPRTVAQRFNK